MKWTRVSFWGFKKQLWFRWRLHGTGLRLSFTSVDFRHVLSPPLHYDIHDIICQAQIWNINLRNSPKIKTSTLCATISAHLLPLAVFPSVFFFTFSLTSWAGLKRSFSDKAHYSLSPIKSSTNHESHEKNTCCSLQTNGNTLIVTARLLQLLASLFFALHLLFVQTNVYSKTLTRNKYSHIVPVFLDMSMRQNQTFLSGMLHNRAFLHIKAQAGSFLNDTHNYYFVPKGKWYYGISIIHW